MNVNDYRVSDGHRFQLGDLDPNDTGTIPDKATGRQLLKTERGRIASLQERLYAEAQQSVLVIFQAMDTGGKDGVIKNVFKGVNQQGCRVQPFKVPNSVELAHDFLWRYHQHTPRDGHIVIFNRSHYEDVLVVRVKNLVDESVWSERFDQINDFERLLTGNGTRILKFFLHISKAEQKERLQARLDTPMKHWKFSTGDLADRALWDEYQEAYRNAIAKCSTDIAPWHVIPANNKWFRDVLVASIIADTLESMNPRFPPAEEGLDQITIPD